MPGALGSKKMPVYIKAARKKRKSYKKKEREISCNLLPQIRNLWVHRFQIIVKPK